MEAHSIREMDDKAIKESIAETEAEIMNLRMQNRIGTTENPVEIRFKKKDAARMRTVLRERELGIERK